MNLRHIEIFLAVVEHSGFSAGAAASFVSQSTASQAIMLLEEELGVQLLERTRRGVRETPAGAVFRKRARRIIAEVAAAFEELEKHKESVRTHLRIAVSSVPGAYIAPALVERLVRENPRLTVTLIQGDSGETIRRVAEGEAVVGIAGKSSPERELVFQPFGSDEIGLVVSSSNPLAGTKPLELANLGGLSLIMREPGSGTAKTVLDTLKQVGIAPQDLAVRAYMGSNEAVKEAVMSGSGAAFISLAAVNRELERGDMALLSIAGLSITRRFYLVRRKGAKLAGPAALIWESLAGQVP